MYAVSIHDSLLDFLQHKSNKKHIYKPKRTREIERAVLIDKEDVNCELCIR